mmetsp:Transcript_11736/g.24014  ORF Transcript_11736/g.24014 Transcript_11736/m.24014 type:complete len:249 (+) Transcript_11736:75-821(+)
MIRLLRPTLNIFKGTSRTPSVSFSSSSVPMPIPVLSTPSVLLLSLPVTPFAMNQYLLCCKTSKEAALVDCGDDNVERWVNAAKEEGMEITKILQTHGHVDHVSGLKDTKEKLGVPVYACADDWLIFKSAPMQGKMFGMACPSPPSIDVEVKEGDVVQVGDLQVRCLHTPGHSPGHLCYEIVGEKSIISGDLIFEGSIGRTDFPGCSTEDMQKSLERIKTEFDRDVKLYPGHMGITTVGREIDTNPFLR